MSNIKKMCKKYFGFCLLFFLFCLVFRQSAEAWEFSGSGELNWYRGKEEVFLPFGLGGLAKQERNVDYRRYTTWASLFLPQKSGRVEWSIANDFDGDIYSNVSLLSPMIDSSQQTKFSNWLNSTNLQVNWPMSAQLRLKGAAGVDFFRDRSFPEFSADEKTASLELERLLRENTYLSFGYQALDVDFISAPLEDYYQRDLYVSFHRYSPAKYRTERRDFTDSYAYNHLGSNFDENSLRVINEQGFFHSYYSLENMRTKYLQKPRYYQTTSWSDMVFELEGRLRHRDLYNNLERSFIEGQLNATARFIFHDNHYLQLKNLYSDRDYARDSDPDIINSYWGNFFELAYVRSNDGFSADTRASYDNYFHKNNKDNDYNILSLQCLFGWDIIKQWNISWFGLFREADYDVPRLYFADYRLRLNSISLSWHFNDGFSLTGTKEHEDKKVAEFESILDASFKREAMDFRLQWQSSGALAYHAGYRFDEKIHTILEDYDRYEDLFYGGTSVSF